MYSTGQVAAIFQSTPSTGRATPEIVYSKLREAKISIHALHGEGDEVTLTVAALDLISIHALHGEGDLKPAYHCRISFVISIHALHGEGDNAGVFAISIRHIISIHALHGEGDRSNGLPRGRRRYFNPRPPRGGRHTRGCDRGDKHIISIHALHGEGDEYQEQKSSTAQAISIHALHGEGDGAGIKSIATYPVISIHAIHGEGDRRMSMLMPQQ